MPRPASPQEYVYRCQDGSRLAAWISRVVAPSLQARIPSGITANHVTVIGTLLLWVAVAAMLGAPPARRPLLALPALGVMWLYCVLDHVDGLHARLRRTSSPLGEYLDHALDAWNVAGVIAIIAAVAGPAVAPFSIAAMLAAGGLAAAATWLEQRESGEIHLGRIGPVEGVFVAGLYLASWAVPVVREWWSTKLGAGFTRADAALLIGGAGTLASAVSYGRDVQRLRGRLIALSLQVAAVVAAGGLQWLSWPVVWLGIVAATATFSGRVITSHLAQTTPPWPECIALPALVLFGLGARVVLVSSYWEWLPVSWLACTALIAFRQTWREFGHHWRPDVSRLQAVALEPIAAGNGGGAPGPR